MLQSVCTCFNLEHPKTDCCEPEHKRINCSLCLWKDIVSQRFVLFLLILDRISSSPPQGYILKPFLHTLVPRHIINQQRICPRVFVDSSRVCLDCLCHSVSLCQGHILRSVNFSLRILPPQHGNFRELQVTRYKFFHCGLIFILWTFPLFILFSWMCNLLANMCRILCSG